MLVTDLISSSDSQHVVWKELLQDLSTRWLVVEWDQWTRSKQSAAASLVGRGAAELRLRCLVKKDATPPPVEAIVVVSGDYWTALTELLAKIAQSVPQWQKRAGSVRIETRKIGARLTMQGETLRDDSRLGFNDQSGQLEIAPAHVGLEACQFENGTPLPVRLPGMSDPTFEAEVSWSLEPQQTAPAYQGAVPLPAVGVPSSETAVEPKESVLPLVRGWKQGELDDAIAAYRDDPANEFFALQDMIQTGSHAAHTKARERFGRNAVVRNLGVRSPAMVTNSHVWQGIAASLDLPRGKHMPSPLRNYEQVPLAAAAGSTAEHDAGGLVDDLIRRETPEAIDQKVREADLKFSSGREAAAFTERIDAIKFCVEMGRLSPDGADELVDLTIEQARDARRRRIKQRPY